MSDDLDALDLDAIEERNRAEAAKYPGGMSWQLVTLSAELRAARVALVEAERARDEAKTENVRLCRMLGNATAFEEAWRGLNVQHSELRVELGVANDRITAAVAMCSEVQTAHYCDLSRAIATKIRAALGAGPVPEPRLERDDPNDGAVLWGDGRP